MKQRNSNIELLRIIAMLMIIDVHFFATCNAGENTIVWSGNWIVYQIMESLGICGVNIFILITGYFSLNQSSIKIRKIINLLLDVAFWGGIGFILCVTFGWKSFEIKELIKTMFPIIFGRRWFVKSYIILLCLMPFINRALCSLTKASYRKLLLILILLFSIWPSYLPNPPIDDYGYGFIHFILLYVIAGYIKLHAEKYPARWLCGLGFIGSAIIVIIGSMFGQGYSWAYDYVFVISEAICLFLFFVQVRLQVSVINKMAACAFGVFLIHTDGFFSVLIYEKMLHCSELTKGSPILFLVSAIISMPVFYVFGFVLERIKKIIFARSIDVWLDKIPFVNTTVEIGTEIHEN